MNCLCCGKPLRTPDETGWHKACIKRFFGTTKLPEIEIDDKTLNLLATETTNKGFTVPGVQKKLSLHLVSDSRPFRTHSLKAMQGLHTSQSELTAI